MAHRVTSPALQRAQRLLQQWVRPNITSGAVPFTVQATDELFEPVSFEDARGLGLSPFVLGTPWGRPWHTRWFKLTSVVPAHGQERDLVAAIDLGFSGRGDGFQAEGMAWLDGRRVQAVQPDRRLVPLGRREAGETIELWVEASATPIIAGHAFGYGPTPLGDPLTAGATPLYVLERADLAVHDRVTEELAGVLHSLIDVIIDSDDSSPQRARLFDLLDRVAEVLDVTDLTNTAQQALDMIRSRTQRWASSSNHRVTAVGHAHLDTAWLWPIRETRRKAVRTFANAIRLLDDNPDAVFCHSQAQQYDWVRQDAPELFERVQELVEQGRWEPIGGMWVETDLNLPAGESLIRHMVHGRRAFTSWFGESRIDRPASTAFLPDDFGYPGSLPQIVRHCGVRFFFSQKMSWNESNSFPHHSFWWEGIDGSKVFTHFSPVDTYNALLTPSQLRFAERNFSDHRGASQSLVLYGHGDGGGGPTQQMIDRVHHVPWFEGLPRVEFGTVSDFFRDAVAEYGDGAPTWVGEMYLEKHRGTYSSQVATKQGNRRCERLLHEWEVWAASRREESSSSHEDRRVAWQRVLTQQFHDIIPGSSIAWVHRDTVDEHRAVAEAAHAHIDEIFGVPTVEAGHEESLECRGSAARPLMLANPAPVPVHGVEWVAGRPCWVDIDPLSVALHRESADVPAHVKPVVVEARPDGSLSVSNGVLDVFIDASGAIADIVDRRSGRSVVRPGTPCGLVIRRDFPAEYDAWDIDLADADSAGVVLEAQGPARVLDTSHLGVTIALDYAWGASRFTLNLRLRAGESSVDFRLDAEWNERQARLQFVLPVDVLAREAVCGVQFGHVRRPRHANTSWDAAKFEVCAHRYVYVNEPGFGVALTADGPRGYDVRGESLRLTVLRSPSFPDPHCDQGSHSIHWGLFVDGGIDAGELETHVARAAHPIRLVQGLGAEMVVPVVSRVPGVLISSLKPAEDASGDIIVRLWETRGARATGVVVLRDVESAWTADGLERIEGERDILVGGDGNSFIEVTMRPFEIATLRLRTNR